MTSELPTERLALERLDRALQEFRDAYAAWAEIYAADPLTSRDLLEEATRRLDAARRRLDEVERALARLRRPGP